MTTLSKAEYLKKYMSNSGPEKAKKRRKKVQGVVPVKKVVPKSRIVDDDVDLSAIPTEDVDPYADEEAPTIAEVVDERPQHVQDLEKYRNEKWKQLQDSDSENNGKVSNTRHDSDSDASPVRRTRHDSDSSGDEGMNQSKSHSSKNSQKRSSSSKRARKDSDSDLSPVRTKGDDSGSDRAPIRPKVMDSDSDQSPVRRVRKDSDSDLSPPRSRTKNSRSSTQGSKKRKDSDSDQSPPRKKHQSDSDQSPVRKKRSRDKSPKNSDLSKVKTSRGAKAGLSTAAEMRDEMTKLRRKEQKAFKQMDKGSTGENAATVVRDKSGKIVDMHEEMKKEREKKEKDEKYSRWSKGVKQQELQNQRADEALHEMAKPLTRYKDDEDLDAALREQDRDGDPMLAFMKSKKSKSEKKGKGLPKYSGPPAPPNRFGIQPGYRWDGVDRYNGYEKKFFEQMNAKKAKSQAAFKWSTEDM